MGASQAGFFGLRTAIYLDPLEPGEGCLDMILDSHLERFGDALEATIDDLGLRPEDTLRRHSLSNEPEDVVSMNHKLYHTAFTDTRERRAIDIKCRPNTTPEQSWKHFDFLVRMLSNETKAWGRFYSKRLIETGGPWRRRNMDLGFSDTGEVTQLQGMR